MPQMPRRRVAVFALLAGFGCLADLITKFWVFHWSGLAYGETRWLWPGHVGIQQSLNEGALFGMGQGLVWLFAAVSVLAALAIPVWLFWFGAARDAWLNVTLGAVMAGVLGNLFDRLGWHNMVWPASHPQAGETVYAVRDWILWQWSDELRWPNFNLADSFLVVGAALLLWHSFWMTDATDKQAAALDKGSPENEGSGR